MLGLLAIFFGATLGAVVLGSILYALFRTAISFFVQSSKVRYLSSIVFSALCVILFSAWGYAGSASPLGPYSGSMNWIASLLYVPGLILIAFVFYRRDVIVPATKNNEAENS
jgi:hypothetical protein